LASKRSFKAIPFLVPLLILISIFVLYPIAATIYYSLYDPRSGGLSLNNYVAVLTSTNPLYALISRSVSTTPPWGALLHNILWVAIHVPVVTLLGMAVAYILKFYVKGSTLIKAMLFTGIVIPPAIGGLLVRFIFDAQIGLVPKAFSLLGIEPLSRTWTSYPETALLALILGSIWIWLGFSVTVFSAALETIPRSHVEAAKLFGASDWQIFYRVIAPQLKPAAVIVVVMTALWDMKIFDIVYASTQGGPGGSSTVLALVMYDYFSRALDYYRAAAVAVILTLAVIPVIFIAIRRMEK